MKSLEGKKGLSVLFRKFKLEVNNHIFLVMPNKISYILYNCLTFQLFSGIQAAGGQAGQAGQIQLIDTIRRNEVDTVLNNLNGIMNTARDLKSYISEVHSKADTILNNQARAPTAQVNVWKTFTQKSNSLTLLFIFLVAGTTSWIRLSEFHGRNEGQSKSFEEGLGTRKC